MVLKVNGVDIVPYIAHRGVKWQRSDIDGESAGRDLTGTLRRDRVATKRRLDITCRPMTTAEASVVLTAILPETVSVEFTDPQSGGVISKTMYSNNNPATYFIQKDDGVEWWEGITFPLIEV